MKLTAQEYARRVQRAGPHSPLGTDCLWAFGVGGGICLLGEVLRQWYLGLGLEADLAGDYVCPFAVRVPLKLCLADFLGSLLTRTIGLSRRTFHTVKFDSFRGFACGNQRLHSLTGYSVSRRRCHSCVPTSPSKVVTEY